MAYKYKTDARKTKNERLADERLMDDMLAALRAEHGVMAWALKRVGVTRKVHDRLANQYPEYADEVKIINEETKDYVFGQLMKLIENGHPASTIFACKTMLHMKDTNINKTTLEITGAKDLVDVNKALTDISEIVKDNKDDKDGGEQD